MSRYFSAVFRSLIAVTVMCCITATSLAAGEPLVESYLKSGKLADGEKALLERLKKEPKDDQARFGLGVLQFLQSYERMTGSFQKYGLRVDQIMRGQPEAMRNLVHRNSKPEKISYEKFREVVTAWIADLNKAEKTLSEVKDEKVKLPLHVGLIRVNLFAQEQPMSAALIFNQMSGQRRGNEFEHRIGDANDSTEEMKKKVAEFVIGFDRGDVSWLRGYCHFMAAMGELDLALDSREMFETCGHLFFLNVDSPHKFLQRENPDIAEAAMRFDRPVITDVVAFITSLRFELQEPKRMQTALEHLEKMIAMSREMWTFYVKETDDEHEWIPNAKQKGVLQMEVKQETIDTWIAMLAEAEEILKGKKLLPFWRETGAGYGVNARKVFTDPRKFNLFHWIQGTAATPYLEKGEITRFTNQEMSDQMRRAFGDNENMILYFIWFN